MCRMHGGVTMLFQPTTIQFCRSFGVSFGFCSTNFFSSIRSLVFKTLYRFAHALYIHVYNLEIH